MEPTGTLTIDRWTNAYRVPSDHPDPEDLRARLDRLVSAQAADACRRRLAPLLDESDPSIWLIRRVDVDLILDASAFVADRTGAAWGEQLAIEICRVLDAGPNGDAVLHFRDHAAFVVQWIRDACAGRASGKWYYAEFDSLGSLPLSAAIAEAIVRGDDAAKILLRLHEHSALETVLAALTNRDAQRIVGRALPRGSLRRAASTGWVARLLALWNGIALSRGDGDAKDALRLFAAAKTEWPDAGATDDAELSRALDDLLKLRQMLAQFSSPDEALAFLRAVIAGNPAATLALTSAVALALPGIVEFVRSASGGDEAWVQCAVSVLASSAAAQSEPAGNCFLTELGGIFLLTNGFRDLGVGDAIQAAALACEEPLCAEPVLRCLLAMRCLGRERAALALGDPAIVAFSGLERVPSLADLAEVQARADAEAALRIVNQRWTERTDRTPDGVLPEEQADYFHLGRVVPELQTDTAREQAWAQIAAMVLRNFARRLPGFAKSSPDYVFRNFLFGTCQVRIAGDRIEVRPAQSPLAVVLRIAGVYQTVSLPWLEGVEICLLAPAC